MAESHPPAKPRKKSAPLPPGIPRKWAWHYRTLVALRDRLRGDEKVKREEAAEAATPSLTRVADRGTDDSDHDLAVAFLITDKNALAEVEAALERIRNGVYGICEITGSPIPPERLRAVPWTRYLREVEERLEKSGEAPKPKRI